MFRGVKSLVSRSVDRIVRLPPSTARIKQPLKSLFGHASTLLPGHHAAQLSARNTSFAQNISSLARAPVHVRANLSLPARIALGRPLSGPFLPRAPTIPRHIAQVGLGTARNFSSSRPIFQNIADNVPIATRAFWEADWEIKGGAKAKVLRKKPSKKAPKVKVADKLKANHASIPSLLTPELSTSELSAEAASQYFVSPTPSPAAKVTTYLTIPLSPPDQRRPLPLIDSIDLLPGPQIYAIHSAHELHAIRVDSLFRRLESADVWSRNVECECYGGSEGRPDFLELIFRGWSEAEVKYVVGEAINGWCTLEYVETAPTDTCPDIRDATPPYMSLVDDLAHSSSTAIAEPSAITFVVPTLDFSTSVLGSPQLDGQQDVWWDPSATGTTTPSIFSDAEYESDGDFASADEWLSVNDGEQRRQQMDWTGEPPSFRSLETSWTPSPWLSVGSESELVYL